MPCHHVESDDYGVGVSTAEESDRFDVVVVGGGFAGLYAATGAVRRGLRVALVDSTGLQTFQPLLYQVATGLLPLTVIDYPLDHARGVQVITGTAQQVDLQAKVVTTADGRTLAGERLVLATGARVNFFGVTGASDYALPLYTDTDAQAIKSRLQSLVETNHKFDVVIVGAGATGVELAGILREVVREVLPRTYPHFRGEDVTVHVVDHAAAPLAHMSAKSQAYARKVLESEGVAFHLGATVTSVEADAVSLADGGRIPAGMVVWAGGLEVAPPTTTPAVATGHGGRVEIDATLRIPGHPDVYCIGDCSADAQAPLPQLGSVAKQQGLHVGRSLHRQASGKEPKPFTYRDLGVMAMLGTKAAVVEAGPKHVEIEGRVAAAMWLGLHASLLPDDRERVDAIHDWLHEGMTKTSAFLDD